MKKLGLRRLVFMALCCDMGIFAKKLISPAANVITEALHIPGGISTAFSLMFIVMASAAADAPGAGLIMGVIQSVVAILMGTTGSMGALAPVGYILPGIIIDTVMLTTKKLPTPDILRFIFSNALASLAAAAAADVIVFRLRGVLLTVYFSASLIAGTLCGALAGALYKRLAPILERK